MDVLCGIKAFSTTRFRLISVKVSSDQIAFHLVPLFGNSVSKAQILQRVKKYCNVFVNCFALLETYVLLLLLNALSLILHNNDDRRSYKFFAFHRFFGFYKIYKIMGVQFGFKIFKLKKLLIFPHTRKKVLFEHFKQNAYTFQ